MLFEGRAAERAAGHLAGGVVLGVHRILHALEVKVVAAQQQHEVLAVPKRLEAERTPLVPRLQRVLELGRLQKRAAVDAALRARACHP